MFKDDIYLNVMALKCLIVINNHSSEACGLLLKLYIMSCIPIYSISYVIAVLVLPSLGVCEDYGTYWWFILENAFGSSLIHLKALELNSNIDINTRKENLIAISFFMLSLIFSIMLIECMIR